MSASPYAAPTGEDRKVLPAAQSRTREERQGHAAAEAARLKTALFAALGKTGLHLTDIAEICGFENANMLYNLKNGHSKTLAVQMYITLSQKLNLPINELLGMPGPASAATPSVRGATSARAAAERLALSLAYINTATEQFYEWHVFDLSDEARKISLFAAFLRIQCGLDAVGQDVAKLFDRLREFGLDLPPFHPK